MRDNTPRSELQNADVSLHHDGIPEPCGCVRFESHGAVFELPRRLDLMSGLVLSVDWCCAECGRRTMRIEAVVVGCCEMCGGLFETTVIFVPGGDVRVAAEFRHLPN